MATWMQEFAPYGILTTDHELQITSWNEWLSAYSGLSSEHVVGRKLLEVFPDLPARRLFERFTRALSGEASVLSTALHKYLIPLPVTVAESGLPHMLQTARVAPLRENETVVGTITIIEDVTQREFQAGILHRQQELDRLLASSLARLLQSNDPAEEIGEIYSLISPALGLDAYASYLLASDGRTLQLKSSGGFSAKQREQIATLAFSPAEWAVLTSENAPAILTVPSHTDALLRIGLRAHATFPLTVGSRVIGAVTFASYERNVIGTADANILTRIARYTAISLDRVMRERDTVAASRAKDDFLAALSHELRTPLNPILLVASDAASNLSYPEEARQGFQLIEKNALLEARLIDDLLDLTRIEHGKISLEMQRLDAHKPLTDALETVGEDIEQRQLSFHVKLDATHRTISADSGRLQQVFWNILKNAVKFTPIRGEVWVTTASNEAATEIAIQVRDTGIGMDADELARVFEAFEQGDHAVPGRSHRFGGLGLGLAISRKLIDLHGGRIEAGSEGKTKGATFTVFLPLAPVDETSDSIQPVALPNGAPTLATAPYREGGRILLVEDHEPTRTTLGHLLKRRGYVVIAVNSSEDAMQAAQQHVFDLVLSDIGLPDSDGFDLMRVLREKHGLKGIALTGYGMEEDRLRSTNAGFLAHLTKPINVHLLDRTLENVFAELKP